MFALEEEEWEVFLSGHDRKTAICGKGRFENKEEEEEEEELGRVQRCRRIKGEKPREKRKTGAQEGSARKRRSRHK